MGGRRCAALLEADKTNHLSLTLHCLAGVQKCLRRYHGHQAVEMQDEKEGHDTQSDVMHRLIVLTLCCPLTADG